MFFSTDTELDPTEMDYVMRQLQIIGEFDRREFPAIGRTVSKELEKKVGTYGRKLANQRYIRTGTYGRSVFSEVNTITDGIEMVAGSHGAIQNGRRYDPYLKDERNQAAIHAGRWTTLGDDADNTMPLLEREIAKAKGRMKL